MDLSKIKSYFTKERFKKIGLLGFLFFLVKGLLWLAVTYYIVK